MFWTLMLFGASLLSILACVSIYMGPDRRWAIPTFLFYPLGIVPLVRNWGHPRFDIKFPYLGAWLVSLVSIMVLWGEASDIAQDYDVRLSPIDFVEMDPIDRQVMRDRTISQLRRRRGQVELAPLPVSMNVPQNFYFLDLENTRNLATAFGLEAERDTVGLMIHKSIELARLDYGPWVIWMSYQFDRRLDWGEPENWNPDLIAGLTQRYTAIAASAYEDPWEFLEFAVQPQIDPELHLVTWAEHTRFISDGAEFVDCYAVRAGRRGYFFISVTDMEVTDEELCFRAARLAASSIEFTDGQGFDDHYWFEGSTEYSLMDLVTGKVGL